MLVTQAISCGVLSLCFLILFSAGTRHLAFFLNDIPSMCLVI